MAFTYIGDLSTDLDKVRFDIGDVVSGTGILPDGLNIPDATISAVITAQGSVGAASVWLCKRIAARWSAIPDSIGGLSRSESNQQVAHFLVLAETLATDYGVDGAGMNVVEMLRDDEYHRRNPYATDDDSEYVNSRIKYVVV